MTRLYFRCAFQVFAAARGYPGAAMRRMSGGASVHVASQSAVVGFTPSTGSVYREFLLQKQGDPLIPMQRRTGTQRAAITHLGLACDGSRTCRSQPPFGPNHSQENNRKTACSWGHLPEHVTRTRTRQSTGCLGATSAQGVSSFHAPICDRDPAAPLYENDVEVTQ
jgi:hypothetical protein